jgi:hypothetical protein
MKAFLLILVGLMSGVALTLSCDDGSPTRIDAAPVCDCPQAEPPITKQRVVEVVSTTTLPPVTSPGSGRGGQGAACAVVSEGAIALSGSCTIDDGLRRDVVIEEFTSDPAGWNCYWKNNTNAEVVMRATVRCLVLGN